MQRIQQRKHVIRHQIVTIGAGVACTAAVTAAVQQDDAVTPGEDLDLIAPIVRIREAAVHRAAIRDHLVTLPH
jgi:hypothetical protein